MNDSPESYTKLSNWSVYFIITLNKRFISISKYCQLKISFAIYHTLPIFLLPMRSVKYVKAETKFFNAKRVGNKRSNQNKSHKTENFTEISEIKFQLIIDNMGKEKRNMG